MTHRTVGTPADAATDSRRDGIGTTATQTGTRRSRIGVHIAGIVVARGRRDGSPPMGGGSGGGSSSPGRAGAGAAGGRGGAA